MVRAVPALVYQPTVGRRQAVAAGLLQATSLPFLVTTSQIGVIVGTLKPVTGAALVSAGLLSCVIFPLVSLSRVRRTDTAAASGQPKSGTPTLSMRPTAEGDIR